MDRIETGMDRIEARIDGIETRLGRIEARLDGFDECLRNVEIEFGKVDQRLLTVERVVLLAPGGRPSQPPGARGSAVCCAPSTAAVGSGAGR